MSDFDDFDDLDAVRDFRSAVGLMTPAVDERIRRRIIDLAIARGIADGARADDDTDHHDGRTEPTIVFDLPEEASVPPALTSAGRGSSDGSAASVVELHPAARPPARQPRVLVAAAAIFVVLVLVAAGAFLVTRRNDRIDVATPLPPVTDVAGLVARIEQQAPAPTLSSSQYLQTVDRVTTYNLPLSNGEQGTQRYVWTLERGPKGTRESTASEGTVQPNSSPTSTAVPVDDPSINPDAPFGGLTYAEVQQLAGKPAVEIRNELVSKQRVADDRLFDVVIRDELDLLRVDITPPSARAQLVLALTSGTYRTTSQQLTDAGFVVDIANDFRESVRITFDPGTGALRSWVHARGGQDVDGLEVISSRTVS